MIALDNLVDALLACADDKSPRSDVYFAKDAEDPSVSELVRLLAQSLGRPARLVPVPTGMLRAAARLVGLESTLTRLIGSFTVDAGRIATDLGWHPRVTLARGVADTVRWYRSAGT
jgi:UDP-glucose 4-epimerase